MINLRSLPLVLALVITFVAAGSTPCSAQVPPRFYWKSLIGGNGVPVIGMFLSGNANPVDPAGTVLDASFEANVALVGYGRTFSLFDRAALVAVLATVGRLSGEVNFKGRTFTEDASGFGDPMFEFDLNLIGPKVIRNIPDLTRYEPGFSLRHPGRPDHSYRRVRQRAAAEPRPEPVVRPRRCSDRVAARPPGFRAGAPPWSLSPPCGSLATTTTLWVASFPPIPSFSSKVT